VRAPALALLETAGVTAGVSIASSLDAAVNGPGPLRTR